MFFPVRAFYLCGIVLWNVGETTVDLGRYPFVDSEFQMEEQKKGVVSDSCRNGINQSQKFFR